MDTYSQKFILRGRKIKRRMDDGKLERVKVLGIDNKSGALMVAAGKGKVLHITARGNVILPKKVRMRNKDKSQ